MKTPLLLLFALSLSTCSRGAAQGVPAAGGSSGDRAEASRFPAFPARARSGPSEAFGRQWFSGDAEVNGYRATVPRYGEARNAELVLIYVTEPMSRRTWIKDDDARGDDRVGVLKLNMSLKFTTGIYPYSVLTSVFSPYGDWGRERLSPVKLTLSAQEWCGHVFHGVWPGEDRAVSQLFSYFAQEGESRTELATPPGALYEDALLIQLRELDGPFAGGHDWRGPILPSLWRTRRRHRPLAPEDATITRAEATVDGVPAHRFTLRYGDFERVIDVERGGAHRMLGWRTNDGEDVRLTRSARLPYWQLNHNADLPRREEIGVEVPAHAAGEASGTVGF
ncbi:MAG: hypothetical protein R3A48_13040 [Polyangiales bacterium]